ncbi:PREDICTED: dipeptidyl peptidase 3-like [Priapulus caudatus]|uniref:Dipeptidyl peptidase 3 n=1 Tax=Priapulus caudatus TaxID=37621 RepID=A0ABM1EYK2_PRICU|nr:PREDICTED: dipeptidyl peptidase 3-like [Priapulus caudatus]XP_014677273.1 PREDICTED: dipeptidyl peptidase 3-like [Priapulus caudatus]
MSSQYVLPNSSPVVNLDCLVAFNCLSAKEKLYTHYLSKAAWHGGLVVLFQTSPESPIIFVLLQKLFRAQPLDELKKLALGPACGFNQDEWQALLVYTSGLYANMGNYKGFGDTKFVPGTPQDKLKTLIWKSAAYISCPEMIENLWSWCGKRMYSLAEKELQLGLGDEGTTTYFSANCTMEDAKLVQKFLDAKAISPYNSRVFKTINDGKPHYDVRLASVNTPDLVEQSETADRVNHLGASEFEGTSFSVSCGDYSALMAYVATNLKKAKDHAANETEEAMLQSYIDSFTTSSLQAHKDGSRLWIKDKGPIVETYIGFIETYRDPIGVRGEFEGFVAIVNKEMSQKFASLVENAETFLPMLPWGNDYEKDRFLRPDFTSLDVVTFSGSGIPAGINIPNYDEIRQNEGFKNVSLGNVLSAGYKEEKVTFLSAGDVELYKLLKAPSFEVQVGLHELLGHGSGKLFSEKTDGIRNFDSEKIKDLETGEKISSWYAPGETYDSKFQVISSTYEECRAECVGLYLCLEPCILKIFAHEGDKAQDIIYVNWLNMVRAGVLGLEFYTPKTKKWRQAHMQARYVILRVLLEAGEGLVSVTKTNGEDGQPDLLVSLDRSKINSVGKAAIAKFLQRLQTYKSTGDLVRAEAMYVAYATVSDEGDTPFLCYRSIVMNRKQPRKLFVQHNTSVTSDESSVNISTYESSPEGLIQSFIERFTSTDVDDAIIDLWKKDQPNFPTE